MHNIVFYTTERGDSPLDDFLDELGKKARAKEKDLDLAEKRMEEWMLRFPAGGEV